MQCSAQMQRVKRFQSRQIPVQNGIWVDNSASSLGSSQKIGESETGLAVEPQRRNVAATSESSQRMSVR